MGRDIFDRIVDAAKVDVGFAHLKDVRTGEHDDAMESFFLAETLKYAWLLARPDAVDFDGVIFNTEAHPLSLCRRGRRGDLGRARTCPSEQPVLRSAVTDSP